MANITKRGDGYRIRVYVGEDVNGKQLFKSMTWTPAPGMTPRQVERELERQKVLFEEKVHSGQGVNSNMKFKDFCELWFRDYAEPNLKHRTVASYHGLTTRTYLALGHIPLAKLMPTHIIEFLRQLEQPNVREASGQKRTDGGSSRDAAPEPLSPKTIRNYLAFISSVLSTAVDWGYLAANPAVRVKPPKQERNRISYLDDVQIRDFLSALSSEPTSRRAMFYLLIFTGMRRGELLGLEWQDIDFVNNTISIVRTSLYSPDKGIYTDTPKTAGSSRIIKTSPEVMQLLRVHYAEQEFRRRTLGDAWKNCGRLFTTWDGAPMHPNTVYSIMQKILKKNGLPQVSLHSLRHSNATLLINSGASIKAVSARLGHSTVSTTMNIYAEQIQSADAAAAAAIDAALLPERAKKTS